MTENVKKIAQLFDEAQGTWFDVFEATGIEGAPITAEVPREDRHAAAIARHLLRRGASLDDAAIQGLRGAAAQEAPVVRRAAQTGWWGKRIFVSHLGVAASGRKPAHVMPPQATCHVGQLSMAGTLKGWREAVSVSRYSTAMTVALCATFAAPLLVLLRRPNFGLVFVGPSRSGKSTAQLVGASAMGFGPDKGLPSMNATEAGMMALAMAFNDQALPLDEVATVKGSKREVYMGMWNMSYALTSGHDILRHPSWTGGNAAVSSFRVIPTFSSEYSPDVWAERNGEARDPGEWARLIGIPVLAKEHPTIFDDPPEEGCGAAAEDWASGRFRLLHQGLGRHRGVAMARYGHSLVRRRTAITTRAQALTAHFEKRTLAPSMSPVARDIVAKFGVLYAGGVIAREAGVLPLERNDIYRSVRRACHRALKALPDRENQLHDDIATLKAYLSEGGILDKSEMTTKQGQLIRQADGWHEEEGQGRRFVVRGTAITGWFASAHDLQRLLGWLHAEGFLQVRGNVQARSIAWAQTQRLWPDGSRPRSFSFYFPRGLADLDPTG